MGIMRALKAKIVERSIIKNRKNHPFDIEYSDRYELPVDAESRQNNSHYFVFTDFNTGETLFLRSALRGGNDTDELWLMYRDRKGNVLLQEKDHIEKGERSPVRVECVEPGKKMRFQYDGNVLPAISTPEGYIIDEEAQPQKLTLDGEFTGTTIPFEFSCHMAPKTMARAISREKFTKSFQQTMKAIHQVHYEQAGRVTATIRTGDNEVLLTDLPAVRDHSFGKREWNYFDRYIWSIVLLENGDFIHTSMMRYPAISNLQAGFYISGEKTKSLYYATAMDDLPAIGTVPESFSLFVVYEDGERKQIFAKEDMRFPFFFDDDYKVVEGVYEFNVDGIRGRGIAEFSFNKDRSRWSRKKQE